MSWMLELFVDGTAHAKRSAAGPLGQEYDKTGTWLEKPHGFDVTYSGDAVTESYFRWNNRIGPGFRSVP